MIKSKQDIVNEINNYVTNWGGIYSEWYVGVASDPRDRLFNKHNVNQNGVWIFEDCATDVLAREIEQYFLNLGMNGGPGGGDSNAKYSYAYKKTASTIENA